VDPVARALFNRGKIKGQQGDVATEIADYTAVAELSGAPVDLVAGALLNRGITRGQQGDVNAEVVDYTAVIELSGAPVESVAQALFLRALNKGQQGDITGEIVDYTAVLNMTSVSGETGGLAQFGRAVSYLKTSQTARAESDLVSALGRQGSPDRVIVPAVQLLFMLRWRQNHRDGARTAVAGLAATMASMPDDRAKAIAVRFLEGLASPEFKGAWPVAWRALADATHGETKESVEMFRAACEVLEGADRAILDRLPPEEREFVASVLERFDEKEAPVSPSS
jgi:hypothetical protein